MTKESFEEVSTGPFFFLATVSCNPGWLRTHCAAKDDLEFLILWLTTPAVSHHAGDSTQALVYILDERC